MDARRPLHPRCTYPISHRQQRATTPLTPTLIRTRTRMHTRPRSPCRAHTRTHTCNHNLRRPWPHSMSTCSRHRCMLNRRHLLQLLDSRCCSRFTGSLCSRLGRSRDEDVGAAVDEGNEAARRRMRTGMPMLDRVFICELLRQLSMYDAV